MQLLQVFRFSLLDFCKSSILATIDWLAVVFLFLRKYSTIRKGTIPNTNNENQLIFFIFSPSFFYIMIDLKPKPRKFGPSIFPPVRQSTSYQAFAFVRMNHYILDFPASMQIFSRKDNQLRYSFDIK